ncbi:MAG: hypothetical protein AB7O39_10565 [Flavobacteriaceae bacterium]
MTITSWDDYFIHQTPYPIIKPFVDTPHWIDRLYWNIHAEKGNLMFGIGLGSYRTTARMDSISYLLHDKEQRILRLARRTTDDDYADPQIGPLRLEIIKPQETWRLIMEENPAGIAWDLTFNARWSPVEYDQFEFGNENGEGTNHAHYVQLGKAEGIVEIDGRALDTGRLLVSRDRSWGVRRPREGQGLLLWLQHQFENVEICFIMVESRDGSIAYFDGAVTSAEGRRKLVAVGHDLKMAPGTRDMLGGEVQVADTEGRVYKIEYVERRLRGYLGGIGYGGWQGRDRGDMFIEADRIDMNQPTEEILAKQSMHLFGHLMRVRLNGGEECFADLEGGITRSSKYDYRPRKLAPAGSTA